MVKASNTAFGDIAKMIALGGTTEQLRALVDTPLHRDMRKLASSLAMPTGVTELQDLADQHHKIEALAGVLRSPVRDVLDSLGAPTAVQRVMASAQPRPRLAEPIDTADQPARTHTVIRSVKDIGEQVRAARMAMGMTQQRFADLAGVGRRFLIELEQGKPSLEIGRVLAVCKVAGLTLSLD